ncbi:MAG: YkgJ family cysteine cluster protein [Myxococcales bacterium]|nr:YkgJ family cysteine cluster protein [Myxococcales bacterium]
MSSSNDALAADLLRQASATARDQILDALDPCSEGALAALVEDLARDVDAELEAIRMDFPLEVECRPGCDACCHHRVYVSPIEAFGLVRALRAERSEAELAALARRARRTARRVERLDPTTHARERVPCPLLGEDGRCLAYATRPVPCRGLFSADARACAGGPEDPVPRHGVALLYGAGYQAGLALGAEALGLDGAPVELAAALAVALTAGAEARWRAGADVFEAARARDVYGRAKRLRVLP